MELTKNSVLITGGTSGIGLELGRTLLKMDNQVILLGRDSSRLADAEKEGFETVQCDMGSIREIENAVVDIQNRFPEINILFNNAGVQYNYSFTGTVIPLRKISDEININVTGQIILTHLLIPVLNTSSKAFIVNTTSGLGAFPKSDGLVYSAGKAAMRNFTIGLRYALRDTSIKVIEFMPPVTDTGMTKGRNEKKMPAADLVKQIIPQMKKERRLMTVPALRLFLWISFLFPSVAQKILSKK